MDNEKAPIIKKIFFDFLLEHPITQIYREAKAAGFTGKSNSAIPRVLSTCVYAGLIRVSASTSMPEKYVKGIHTPIVSASDYWRCQELLGNKAPLKSLPDNEVPLRGILRHECGASMTAGYSKGKKKYYLYYRCTKCSSVNMPGEELHEKFTEMFKLLSLTSSQVDYLIQQVKTKLDNILQSRKSQLKSKSDELIILEKKLDGLEEKLMKDEIESATYKKWYKKFMIQKSILESEIHELKKEDTSNWPKIERLLPALLDLPGIFRKATIFQKHSIIREVFKAGLILVDGILRTPWLNPALAHNELILKEKRLLLVEQPCRNSDEITICSGDGSLFEHLDHLLTAITLALERESARLLDTGI